MPSSQHRVRFSPQFETERERLNIIGGPCNRVEQEQLMNENPAERPKDARILTLAEAVESLHTSYSTVYRLVTDGELDAFRLRTVCKPGDARNKEWRPAAGGRTATTVPSTLCATR